MFHILLILALIPFALLGLGIVITAAVGVLGGLWALLLRSLDLDAGAAWRAECARRAAAEQRAVEARRRAAWKTRPRRQRFAIAAGWLIGPLIALAALIAISVTFHWN